MEQLPIAVSRATFGRLAQGAKRRMNEGGSGSVQLLEADEVVRSAMPGRLYDVFRHYKNDEWERYLAAVTDWERDEYLEVLP